MTASPLRAVADDEPANAPAFDLDAAVRRLTELQDTAEAIAEEIKRVKAGIAEHAGIGKHTTSYGVTATVSAPSRRFDLSLAVAMLEQKDPAALERCRLDGYDAKKVRAALPGELVDVAMQPGTGSPVVRLS